VIRQPVLFAGLGTVVVGRKVRFGWCASSAYYNGYSYVEARTHVARIEIADRVTFNNTVTLISEGPGIRIDSGVLVGTDVEMFDSDFHALSPDLRRKEAPATAPVHIEPNVFIGSGVRILKGVTIGSGSVIGSGAVVTRSVPERSVAAGNPPGSSGPSDRRLREGPRGTGRLQHCGTPCCSSSGPI
jgi:maltose O-acetyltransferase